MFYVMYTVPYVVRVTYLLHFAECASLIEKSLCRIKQAAPFRLCDAIIIGFDKCAPLITQENTNALAMCLPHEISSINA